MPPLVKPSLPPVAAGQPITAQGWNVILGALDDLFDGINAFGSLSLAVTLTASGAPLKNAVVVAVPGSGQPVTGDACKKLGAERGNNKKLVECLQPDRRVEIEVLGSRQVAGGAPAAGTGSSAPSGSGSTTNR